MLSLIYNNDNKWLYKDEFIEITLQFYKVLLRIVILIRVEKCVKSPLVYLYQ